MIIKKHLGPSLIKVSEFAKLKNVSIPAVWSAINADRIEIIHVGKNNDVWIDPNTKMNKSIVFAENKKNR